MQKNSCVTNDIELKWKDHDVFVGFEFVGCSLAGLRFFEVES